MAKHNPKIDAIPPPPKFDFPLYEVINKGP